MWAWRSGDASSNRNEVLRLRSPEAASAQDDAGVVASVLGRMGGRWVLRDAAEDGGYYTLTRHEYLVSLGRRLTIPFHLGLAGGGFHKAHDDVLPRHDADGFALLDHGAHHAACGAEFVQDGVGWFVW
jgi:hypothetical protein